MKAVADLADHSLGKMLDKAKNRGEPRPYLRNLNVRWLAFDLSDIKEMPFLPAEEERYSVRKGDLLICEGGYPGRAAIWDSTEPIYFQKALHRVRFHEPAHAKWCLYYLLMEDLTGRLRKHFNGTGIQHFTGEALARFQLPIPAPGEVQRIVAFLDEAFEGIATAKANAEKNLQNARELFESAVDAALSRYGDDFAETTLGDEIDLVAGYAFSSKGYTDAAKGIRLLRGDNIMQGYLRWDDAKGWPADDVEPYARFSLREGDVVLAMDRPWVKAGLKRAQISAEDLPCLQLQRTARLRPRRRLTEDFLYHLTGSKSFSRHLLSVQTGLGVPHISGKQIESFRFMLPPLSEQDAIAGMLDDLQQRSERLEDIYQQKLVALDELKRSLLRQAFSGQLASAKTKPVSAVLAPLTTSPEYSANVIALAYERHKRQQRERTFGHVKEQKLLHLVEAVAKVDLGRQPMKDAAGPNDFQHMLKAEEWAKQNGFFEMVQREGGYDFKKLPAFDQLLAKTPQVLGADLARIESVIDLLVPIDTVDAEVLATVHAAWNNLLIDGAEITDAALIREARDGWHADKLAIPESKFRQAIALIRSKDLVPDGTGKYVGGQTALL